LIRGSNLRRIRGGGQNLGQKRVWIKGDGGDELFNLGGAQGRSGSVVGLGPIVVRTRLGILRLGRVGLSVIGLRLVVSLLRWGLRLRVLWLRGGVAGLRLWGIVRLRVLIAGLGLLLIAGLGLVLRFGLWGLYLWIGGAGLGDLGVGRGESQLRGRVRLWRLGGSLGLGNLD
jgi:hypothetical protein